MKTIEVFDPPLCCSTGVCGTEVDQALVSFAADVEWARRQGARVERFNLAQQPTVFAERPVVKAFLECSGGSGGLPLVLVDGKFAMAGRYPDRADLARLAGISSSDPAQPAAPCCSGSRCC